MKCLSIRQPWADLIIEGKKTIEVRCWQTPYRGKLFIHAAKTKEKNYPKKFLNQNRVTGAVIGAVELIDIKKASAKSWGKNKKLHLSSGPMPAGKTFFWFLEKPKKIKKPITVKGRLGLFNVSE